VTGDGGASGVLVSARRLRDLGVSDETLRNVIAYTLEAGCT